MFLARQFGQKQRDLFLPAVAFDYVKVFSSECRQHQGAADLLTC